MTHSSPVNFKLIHFLVWINGPHKSPNFETFSALVKICQIPHVIFGSTSQFSFKFCINLDLQYHQTCVLCTFLAQTLYTLVKSNPLECKYLRFSNAWVKICQIAHVNFELTSQFLFNFRIICHCNDT